MEKTFFIDQVQVLKESVYRIFSKRRRQKRIVADEGDEDFKFISGIILSYVRHLTLLFGQYKNRYEIIYHRIYEIIENEIIDGEGKTVLCKIINQCFDGIADKLRESHPELRDTDVEFLCFLAAGFTALELMLMYRLESVEAVYVKCSRLKKNTFGLSVKYLFTGICTV